jgi:hypothetical protein
MRALLLSLMLSSAPADESVPPSGPPCKSVEDCWLDSGGAAIARPKRLRKKPFPRGDCGMHHQWLSHRLSCDEGRCVSRHVGDKC